MSSLDAVLNGFQLLDYMSVAGAAVVCYDYTLTFSREVDLIWGRSWSMMSILFIAARYLGLALAIGHGFWSGVGVLSMSKLACITMFHILTWGGLIYILVTKAIMILRVAVMFNHPKRTTYILSFLYLLVVIEQFIMDFLWMGPHSGLIISSVTLVDDTICSIQLGRSVTFPIYGGVPAGLFDLLILALSLYRFAIHAIETRKMLGRARVNVYMRLLFEHSVIYFVLSLAGTGLADGAVGASSMVYFTVAIVFGSTVPYVLFPRLVLSFKGHRSESGGLYVGSDPPQRSHPQSHSASSGGPRGEEYQLRDVISLGRLP